jgi:Tol biopolymer transport system component
MIRLPLLAIALFAACGSLPTCPISGGRPADDLIQPGEVHFKHLWQLTDGGENAEAYWSFAGDRLILQSRRPKQDVDCDRIYVTEAEGVTRQISNGRGVTTCSYFLPGDEKVLFASTQAAHETCPPPPDRSQGYVWALHPEYDIYVQDLASGLTETLIGGPGYDAEATISPNGERMVFTSTRSGDIELWTCKVDGTDMRQVTDEPGYDGGAFFSHDGQQLVWRSTQFSEENREAEVADYRALLEADLVRPSRMEIMLASADGSGRRQVTRLGKASFAPYFFHDDERIIFSSNHHDPNRPARNFDLFSIRTDGEELEQITFFNGERGKQFDSFPMFSPDGRYLAFSSNRGTGESGETNVFIAEWQ